MNGNFHLLEMKRSSTPFELNQPFTSDQNQSENESFRYKASQDNIICYTIDSNDSSSFVATQNSIQSKNIDSTNNSNDNKLKRKHPIENNYSIFKFTTLKYDVTEIMFKEPTISVNVLVKKVKNILIENEINQKLFGKALLNCAESTISLLLSRPKDWKFLSRRGKNPYYKMYFWLKDPNGLNKLTTWIQNYKRIDKMSKIKHSKIDDDDDLNESVEFVSQCDSPMSIISNNSTKPNNNSISLNEIQLHEPLLQHQPQMQLQPVSCTTSSSFLSEAASFRPPIQFINPEQTQLPLTQSNPTVLTQPTPSYIISRPYAYYVTNNDQIFEISHEQLTQLENYHKINPYPTNDALIHLSQVINININSLVHWFKSRNIVTINMPVSYNSCFNCHTCLSGSSFSSYSK